MSYSGDAFELGRTVHLPLPSGLASMSNSDAGELVDELRSIAAEINRLEARKHAALSELYARRDEGRRVRTVDDRRFVAEWDEVVAEAGAALQVGRGAAGAAIHRALDLRDRCPNLFEMFAAGAIGMVHVRAALRSAAAILDDDLAREYDVMLASWIAVTQSDPSITLTGPAIERQAMVIVTALDRDAVREKPAARENARLEFHARSDGAVDLEAVLPKADAIRLSSRIDELAQTVCRADSRSAAQRRVAALLALVSGHSTLGCECDSESCTLRERLPRTEAANDDVKALAVIVLGEADFAAHYRGEPTNGAAAVLCDDTGVSGPVTAQQALDLIDECATTIRTLGQRDPDTGTVYATGASGYTPTQYQLLVMRLLYPTCVFPGCSVSSTRCQADHVAEYDHENPRAGGATTVAGGESAGNLVPLCGFHHRIKTETGWLSDVRDDGAVEWRHPAGGVWVVPPSSTRDRIPGLGSLTWRVRETDVPDETQLADAEPSLDTHARRRAAARRTLRTQNRRLRLNRTKPPTPPPPATTDSATRRAHHPEPPPF